MKNLKGRIKKSGREIEKWEFEGLIIDRSKSQQEIDAQIDQLDEEFQRAECSEGIPELGSDGDQYSNGLGDVLPAGGKMGRPHYKMLERCEKAKRNDPKRRGGKKKSPWKLNYD